MYNILKACLVSSVIQSSTLQAMDWKAIDLQYYGKNLLFPSLPS